MCCALCVCLAARQAFHTDHDQVHRVSGGEAGVPHRPRSSPPCVWRRGRRSTPTAIKSTESMTARQAFHTDRNQVHRRRRRRSTKSPTCDRSQQRRTMSSAAAAVRLSRTTRVGGSSRPAMIRPPVARGGVDQLASARWYTINVYPTSVLRLRR